MTALEARRRARQLFPTYSRARRARWVWLALRADGVRVPVGTAVDHRAELYRFPRAGGLTEPLRRSVTFLDGEPS